MKTTRRALSVIGAIACVIHSQSARADEPSEPLTPPAPAEPPPVDPAAEQGPPLPPLPPPPVEREARRKPRRPHVEEWRPESERPLRLPYREGKATPPGYEVETVPRSGMIVGGALMAGGLHLVSMIAAVALDAEADETLRDEQGGARTDPEFDSRYTPLFIPLVGPFIAVKTSEASGTGMAILVMNGVAQITGCSLVIAGLASPKKVLTKQDPVVGVEVVPLLSKDVAGMALQGAF